MPMWLRLALVSALTALVLGGLAQLITRGKPVTLDGTSGSITPEKTSAAVTVTIGAGVAVAGLWLFLDGHNGFAPLALALAGAAIAGFMAPSLGHRHDVRWTDEVVEGPSRLLGPTLGLARNAIPWRDIVATGATLTGYWYVETRDRRRVYWSFLYQGNQAFAAAIRAHCPSVTVPSR